MDWIHRSGNAGAGMSKIRNAARGRECQIRIDPELCTDVETTVGAHLNGAGMAKKHPDFQSAFGCSRCHAFVDGAKHSVYSREEIEMMHYQGILRTQRILFEEGLIITPGSK